MVKNNFQQPQCQLPRPEGKGFLFVFSMKKERIFNFRLYDKSLGKFWNPFWFEVSNQGDIYIRENSLPSGTIPAIYVKNDDENYILQQFTGAYDILGKPIFEGDMVRYLYCSAFLSEKEKKLLKPEFEYSKYESWGENPFEVTWNNQEAGFGLNGGVTRVFDYIPYIPFKCEVSPKRSSILVIGDKFNLDKLYNGKLPREDQKRFNLQEELFALIKLDRTETELSRAKEIVKELTEK